MGTPRDLILQQLISQPQQQPYSPADVQQMKQLIQLNGQEEQKSLGHGLQQIFAGLANPQYRTTLGALANSMPGAVSAYSDERNRVNQLNANVLSMLEKRRENEMDRQQRNRETYLKHSEENKMTPYQQIMTELAKRRLDENSYQKSDETTENLRQSGKIPEGAVPFSVMTSNEVSQIRKEYMQDSKEADKATLMKKTLAEMKRISNENPDIATDFVRYLDQAEPGKPETLKQFAFKAYASNTKDGKKKLAAIQEFKKLTSKLIQNDVKIQGGGRVTDVLKKTIREGIPDLGMTNEAINYMVENTDSELDHVIHRGKEVNKALSGRYEIPRAIESSEKVKQPKNINPALDISKKLDVSPDIVEEAMAEMGLSG